MRARSRTQNTGSRAAPAAGGERAESVGVGMAETGRKGNRFVVPTATSKRNLALPLHAGISERTRAAASQPRQIRANGLDFLHALDGAAFGERNLFRIGLR